MNELRWDLRNEQANREFASEFAAPNVPSRAAPMPATCAVETQTHVAGTRGGIYIAGELNNNSILPEAASGAQADTVPAYHPTIPSLSLGVTSRQPEHKRARPRCRRCGLVIADNPRTHARLPPPPHIPGERHSFRFLKAKIQCTVAENEIEPPFPLQYGETFPRRPRIRKRRKTD